MAAVGGMFGKLGRVWNRSFFIRMTVYSTIGGIAGMPVQKAWSMHYQRQKYTIKNEEKMGVRARMAAEAKALSSLGLPIDSLRMQKVELALQLMSPDKLPVPDDEADAAADKAAAPADAAAAGGADAEADDGDDDNLDE